MRINIRAILCSIIAFSVSSHAETWSRKQVEDFHNRYNVKNIAEESNLILPISKGYDQGNSGMCWMYAALNALESNYLLAHSGSSIAMSRAAMQHVTVAERYEEEIKNSIDYITDRGTVVDAIDLLRNYGAYGLNDHHNKLKETPEFNPVGNTVEKKMAYATNILDKTYGKLPDQVHAIDSGNLVTPVELGQELTGSDKWISYAAISKNHPAGWGPHWDPDARPGTKSYYVPSSQFEQIIEESLSRGHALTVSWCGHSEEIYGVGYTAGKIVSYFIKGSYGTPGQESSFLYRVNASSLLRACGLHTIQL
jgi:hypothetical protein